MHISHVEIANFRALETVSVPLNQFSVLIGENDVGKTSFLYALDKFFANKKLDEKTDWFKEDVKNDIRIVLTFRGVPSDPQLGPFVKGDGSIVISKVFPFEKPPAVKAILDGLSAVDLPKAVLSKWFSSNSFHFIPVRKDLAVQFSMTKTALLGMRDGFLCRGFTTPYHFVPLRLGPRVGSSILSSAISSLSGFRALSFSESRVKS